jgi:CysZ protein
MLNGNPANAFNYLSRGAGLLLRPGLKRFIIVPLLINLVIFVITTLALINMYRDLLTELMQWLPDWLAFIAWILWLLFAFLLLVVYGYTFNIITNLVAAPFYGVLAEKIEQELTGKEPASETLAELIPRTIKRELTKLWYFISRGFFVLLVLVILWFIPVLNFASAIISVLWAAWCMAVQYIDYPADNHQLAFRTCATNFRHNH